MNGHYVGELAYYDTFSGLVPCKVTNVRRREDGRTRVSVKLTATRGTYRRGEEIPDLRPDYVVPRSSVRVRSGMYRIRNNYTWQPMGDEQ